MDFLHLSVIIIFLRNTHHPVSNAFLAFIQQKCLKINLILQGENHE